jgi:hypothetical protein
VTAADWSAVAEWVVAASILSEVISWSWRQRQAAVGWFTRPWRRSVVSVLRSEVTAGAATPRSTKDAFVTALRYAAPVVGGTPASLDDVQHILGETGHGPMCVTL